MFKYVSAGCTPDDLKQRIFIKYKKNNISELDYTQEENYLHIVTPDREIWITEDQNFYPTSFDEYLSPNIYEHGSVTASYCDRILFSAHNWKKAVTSNREDWCTNRDLKIFVDSGGAQLRFGTANFVNPRKVMDVYNRCADVAMALDIPPRPIDKDIKGHLELLAEQQKRNEETFKRLYTKERKIEFKNILHGFTLQQHTDWIKKVDSSFFDAGWAVGYDSTRPLFNILAVFNLLESAKHTKPTSIHFLGAAGKSLFPVFAWLGKYVQNLTCDSSQHVHTAIRARIMEFFSPDGKISQWKLGTEKLLNKDTGHIRLNTIEKTLSVELPSGVPLLSSLKYAGIFDLSTGTGLSNILSAHNLISNKRYCDWWSDRAQNSTFEEYKKLMKESYQTPAAYNNALQMCKFIEDCVKHGWRKTMQKYPDVESTTDNDLIPVLFGKKKEKKAVMENLRFRESAVVENLPNYMAYSELKKFMTEEEYKKSKLMNIFLKNKKKNGGDFDFDFMYKKHGKHIDLNAWSLDEELKELEASKKRREEKAAKKAARALKKQQKLEAANLKGKKDA